MMLSMKKDSAVPLSTLIDPRIKRALAAYCKKRGLKLRHVIEESLLEKLEDEIDRQAFYDRRDEKLYSIKEVLGKSKRSR